MTLRILPVWASLMRHFTLCNRRSSEKWSSQFAYKNVLLSICTSDNALNSCRWGSNEGRS